MTDEIIKGVLEKRRAACRAAEAEADDRKRYALSLPEVAKAHREYVYALHDSLRLGGKERKLRAEEAYDAYLAALGRAGFSEEDFSRQVTCPICKDLGVTEKGLCSCVHEEVVRALGVACDISPDGFALEDFEKTEVHGRQADLLEKIYARMNAYAQKFPEVNKQIIVCSGKTGTGKDHARRSALPHSDKTGAQRAHTQRHALQFPHAQMPHLPLFRKGWDPLRRDERGTSRDRRPWH